jgi:hypothetical protein
MNRKKLVLLLTVFVSVLALLAAVSGIIWQGEGVSYTHQSVRGDWIEIYGKGLYQHDGLLIGAGNRGVDVVVTLLGIPLLLLSARAFSRGSFRGALLLMGMLAYFLYVYATHALATAYNSLFLVYVALFSASFYGFVLLWNSLDLEIFTSIISEKMPHKRISKILIATGVLTLAVWLEAPLNALFNQRTPELSGGTTLVTHALDLAIMVPAFFISGACVARRKALGFLMAVPLLVVLAMLVPSVILSTISQIFAGFQLTLPQLLGYISGFVILGIFAIWAIVALLRNLTEASE